MPVHMHLLGCSSSGARREQRWGGLTTNASLLPPIVSLQLLPSGTHQVSRRIVKAAGMHMHARVSIADAALQQPNSNVESFDLLVISNCLSQT